MLNSYDMRRLSADWDEYWKERSIDLPAPEPAYSFLVHKIEETFGTVRGVRVVELGAGRGDISFLLAKAGAQVTLIDSSQVALQQSQGVFSANGLAAQFIHGDLLKMRFTQPSFDVAMSFGLVEHFNANDRHRLVDLHKIGRLVFVSVPNALCFPYRLWKFALETTNHWPFGTETPFTAQQLRNELQRDFADVQVFATPLSYTLARKLRLPSFVQLPLDDLMAYQLVGYGKIV
jgi:2-polyprenyl-3-methyl-5-hydroxy-6-metoxy-1,4-benzoquinol methylase